VVAKDLFYLDYEGLLFPVKKLFSLQAFSNFKFTSNQRDAFLIDDSLCFLVFSFPYWLKFWYKSKFKSKIVFIVMIYTTTSYVSNFWNFGVKIKLDKLLILSLELSLKFFSNLTLFHINLQRKLFNNLKV